MQNAPERRPSHHSGNAGAIMSVSLRAFLGRLRSAEYQVRRVGRVAASIPAGVRAAGGPFAAFVRVRQSYRREGLAGLKRALRALEASAQNAFDEAGYLASNPDVEDAVKQGIFRSGGDHFERVGRNENRSWIKTGSRRDKLLRGIDVRRSTGVEIGALANPAVRKSEGAIVYVDYADTAFLREHYRNDPAVDCDAIVDVDRIWGSNTLREALGEDGPVDYVVASHVIEHVPDLISWLEEIRSILRPGGSLRLAVPDRRYTFDYLRRETVLSDLLDAKLRKARAPLPRMILECELSYRPVDVVDAWNGTIDEALLEKSSRATPAAIEGMMARAQEALETGAYHDTHCWVFTPESFASLFEAAGALGFINFSCENLRGTEKYQLEFFVALKPCEDRVEIAESWRRATSTLRLSRRS
jgi:SAM-dependent methyltransferase